MALTKCHECGREISSESKTCPLCGAKAKKPTGMAVKILAVLFAIGLFGMIIRGSEETADQPSSPQDPLKEMRYEKTAIAAKTLKNAMRNPDSFQVESILASDDAGIVCVRYRSQNGFGGMNREYVVYRNGKPSQNREVWNKYCTDMPLNDMTYVRTAL
jgi:hypothetical protein